MKINTQKFQTPIKLNVKKAGAEESTVQKDQLQLSDSQIDAKYDELQKKMDKLNKTEKFRMAGIMGGTILAGAALGAAGGLVTGIGGSIIGGVTGLVGGVTVGALGGSAYAEIFDPHAGSGALAYLGIGGVIGAAAGAVGGAIAGYGASAVVGGIAGALGGTYVGYTLHYMNEDRLMDNAEKEVFGKK